MAPGRKGRGIGGKPREHRRLRHRQLPAGVTEETLSGGLDSVGAVPKVDLVQVELEDLFLGKGSLQANRQDGLADLALQSLRLREEDIARQLLGDGACSLADVTSHHVGQDCAPHRPQVHAPMVEEATVFRCQDRAPHDLGDLDERDGVAVLEEQLADDIAVTVEKHGVLRRGDLLGTLGRGEVAPPEEEESVDRAHQSSRDQRGDDQKCLPGAHARESTTARPEGQGRRSRWRLAC